MECLASPTLALDMFTWKIHSYLIFHLFIYICISNSKLLLIFLLINVFNKQVTKKKKHILSSAILETREDSELAFFQLLTIFISTNIFNMCIHFRLHLTFNSETYKITNASENMQSMIILRGLHVNTRRHFPDCVGAGETVGGGSPYSAWRGGGLPAAHQGWKGPLSGIFVKKWQIAESHKPRLGKTVALGGARMPWSFWLYIYILSCSDLHIIVSFC